MIPFLVVKTRFGLSYVRPDSILAVHGSDAASCTIMLTGGLYIEASEPAEDVVARLEARARKTDEALMTREHR
jgi:hypothetical protein